MVRRPPRATRPYSLFPYTTLCRSARHVDKMQARRDLDVIGDQCIGALGAEPARPAHGLGMDRNEIDGRCDTILAQAGDERLEIVQHVFRSPPRSEEHTSELQSLMRISYAVFCLQKKKKQ